MNIYIKDNDIRNILLESTITTCNVGSKLYKLDDSGSDSDIMHIYASSDIERNMVFENIHQLQYKDNSDYLFCSLHTFISNILRGDSTINFELLHTEKDGTIIDNLRDIKRVFYTYSMAKSYIGLARRDYKYFHKRSNQRDIIKGILHIKRGILSAKEILNSWKDSNELNLVKEELIELKGSLLSNGFNIKTILSDLNNEITNTYAEINTYYDSNKKKVALKCKKEDMILLQNVINSITSNDIYIEKSNYSNKIGNYLFELYSDAYEN